MGQQCLTFLSEDRAVAAAIEQLQAQFRLQIRDGMADGRLHAQQPCRAGSKAAAVGHSYERTNLIQCHAIEHDLLHRSS